MRHAKAILATAVILAVLGAIYGSGLTNHLSPAGVEDPSSESSQANTLVAQANNTEPVPGVIVLVKLETAIKKSIAGGPKAMLQQLALALRIHQIEKAIEADKEVGKVRSALDVGANLVSRNGLLTYLTVQFRSRSELDDVEAARRLAGRLHNVSGVRLSGADFGTWQASKILNEDARRAELIAFPLLFLLLLWFFRSLVAAALPLILGGSAIILTQAGLRLATEFLSISSLVLSIVTALGIGLAIDYSLLIVSRFREELARDPNVPQALERTMRTAGRTVLFSALTAAAALASLLLLPQRLFYSMGLGGMLVALLVCLAALTVLPAILALLGPRINAFAPQMLQRSAQADARPVHTGRWYRFAMLVMRRPILVALSAGALLLAFGLPALGVKLTMTGVPTMPTSTSARQVSDILSANFKNDPNRTVEIVTVGATSPELKSYRHALGQLPGVSTIASVQHLGHRTSVYYLTSKGGATSDRAQQLVGRVRALRAPFETKVTGPTASFVDLKASLRARLPFALLWIVLTTFLSIFLLTGSVVLPPKTLLMNFLTAAATLGLLVLVFQDRHLQGLLGSTSLGAIEVMLPVFVIAIVFALSTDYGVFLIDRIREAHKAGSSNEQAIAIGLERTGRITTTAALLLCVAIGSLVTSRIVATQEIGLGISFAVLLDATVVRALLVPALMRLLGEANWWSPAPLRHLHDRIWSSSPTPDIGAAGTTMDMAQLRISDPAESEQEERPLAR